LRQTLLAAEVASAFAVAGHRIELWRRSACLAEPGHHGAFRKSADRGQV